MVRKDQVSLRRSEMSRSNSNLIVKFVSGISIYFLELKAPTRFSSKPPATNTFLNFQPGPKTPGYLSDNAKFHFKRDLNVKVDFQAEDKQKKNKIQESKLREKQSNNDWFAHRITSDEIKKESLAQQKITHKAGVKQLYEVACHAQNL